MLGLHLVAEAKARQMNVMVETSGRDIAMFDYVDRFFDDADYNKLVVHFSVNDIKHAERSVDCRMLGEMENGKRALDALLCHREQEEEEEEKHGTDSDAVRRAGAMSIIEANEGGPYGSAVLRSVQEASDRVWGSVQAGSVDAGATWFKASIAIEGDEDEDWTARPIRPTTAASIRRAFKKATGTGRIG
jgi:hypothetical protein